jgi:hypothetical protein
MTGMLRVVFGAAWAVMGLWFVWAPRSFAGAILVRGGRGVRAALFAMVMFFSVGLLMLSRTIDPPWSIAVTVAGALGILKAFVLLREKTAAVLALWSEEFPPRIIRIGGLIHMVIGAWIIVTG